MPSSPSATLGEERHSAKKNVTWRPSSSTPLKLKKIALPSVAPWHSAKRLASPSALSWHSAKGLFAEWQGRHSGKNFFFVFLPHFFCEAFLHYLKLLVQIWDNFDFFWYISLIFFVSLNFFCILQIWTAGAWNNRIWWFKKWYSWYLVYVEAVSRNSHEMSSILLT